MDDVRDALGRFTEGNQEGHKFEPGNRDGRLFGPDNKAAEVHGGEGAIKAIQQGVPFKGLAASEERRVRKELADSGRLELMRQNAIRMQTASNLYWGAVLAAADKGDIAELDARVKRYGWIAGATLRAWISVGQAEVDRGPVDLIDAAIAEAEKHTEDGKGQ